MKTAVTVLLVAYTYLSVFVVMQGAINANRGGAPFEQGSCIKKPTRIEKFFPAYKAACYLFSNQERYYGELE